MTTMDPPAARAIDFLSQLPSDVLISILEKMDLRDAIRAGVLSRRWRRLSSQLPRLMIGYEDFLPKDPDTVIYYYDGDEEQQQGRPDDALWAASDKMIRVAMALLESRRSAAADHHVCTLSMSLLLRHNYMSLGRVLDDAVASGKVRQLELKISTTYRLLASQDRDSCKATIRAMLRYGRPRFMALLDSCPAAFGAALTRLALECTRLRDPDDLTHILNACPKLETLSLVSSGSVSRSSREEKQRLWSVRHARLTDVSFVCCNFNGGLSLACLPRLERFVYDNNWDYCGGQAALSFGHVPCLHTLTMSSALLDDDEQAAVLSQTLANTGVAHLCLSFIGGGQIWVQPEAPKRFKDIFRNLKHLKIHNVHEDCGLTWTLFLLQAAPSLKELHIKLWWDHECQMNDYSTTPTKKNVPWEVAADFKHYNLTQLSILGFYSTQERIVAYLHSLAQAAVNLEEIHMYENQPCQYCHTPAPTGIGSSFPRTEKDKDALRESVSLIFRDGGSMSFKIFLYSSSQPS